MIAMKASDFIRGVPQMDPQRPEYAYQVQREEEDPVPLSCRKLSLTNNK